uniref:Uncharacterized protein n=1 Tax=Arundo donax TaxID=35708 RepID=A0A0A9F162_ARUDO
MTPNSISRTQRSELSTLRFTSLDLFKETVPLPSFGAKKKQYTVCYTTVKKSVIERQLQHAEAVRGGVAPHFGANAHTGRC